MNVNVLELTPKARNQWVVLDRGQNLVDHGPDLEALYARHREAAASLTFYFASADKGSRRPGC